MPHLPTNRGLSRAELMVIAAVLLVVLGLVLPALCTTPGRTGARQRKDQTQLKQIGTSALTFATDASGNLPLPGRAGHDKNQQDCSLNTAQNLFSMLVAGNYVSASLLRSPCEVNPQVVVRTNYNYSSYNPGAGTYWDPGFEAHIDAQPGSDQHCNTSYTHLVLCGKRLDDGWRNSASAKQPHFSTRGVRDGATYGPEYERSPARNLVPVDGHWGGHICFADSHVERVGTPTPASVLWSCGPKAPRLDNIFAADFTDEACLMRDAHGVPQPFSAGDTWLGICPGVVTRYSATPLYDALLPAR